MPNSAKKVAQMSREGSFPSGIVTQPRYTAEQKQNAENEIDILLNKYTRFFGSKKFCECLSNHTCECVETFESVYDMFAKKDEDCELKLGQVVYVSMKPDISIKDINVNSEPFTDVKAEFIFWNTQFILDMRKLVEFKKVVPNKSLEITLN